MIGLGPAPPSVEHGKPWPARLGASHSTSRRWAPPSGSRPEWPREVARGVARASGPLRRWLVVPVSAGDHVL